MSTSVAFDIFARDHASAKFMALSKNVDNAGDSASKTRGKFAALGKAGAALAVTAGVMAVKFGVDAIGAASDLNETLSKSSVIFGKNAREMEKWADGAARSMGLSKQAALASASGFGDMFSQIGFTGKQAKDMSKQVVQMSADLGSFNNLDTADVADRMSAAFRGEFDSLQALIPNINATRVETEALAMTGKKAASELTAQEKAAATLAIVQKDGARAAGDFERTSGSLANQQKILQARFENVKAELGQKLLPIAVKVVSFLNGDGSGAFEKVGEVIEKVTPIIKDLAEKWLKSAKEAFEGLKDGMKDAQPFFDLIGQVITNVLFPALKKIWEIAGPAVGEAFRAIGKAFGVVGKVFTGTWNNLIQPVFKFLLTGLAKVLDGIAKMLSALGEVPGFGWAKDAADKLKGMADKAQAAADGLEKIRKKSPVNVDVNIRQNYIRTYRNALTGGGNQGTPVDPSLADLMGGNASGTARWRGGWTRVGERGPEMVRLPGGSRIDNAAMSRDSGGGIDYRRLGEAVADALASRKVAVVDAGRGAYMMGAAFSG